MRIAGSLLLAVLVVICGSARAGGLLCFGDSWPIGAASTRNHLLKTLGKSSTTDRGFLFMAGQGRLFEMPELEQTYLGFESRQRLGSSHVKLMVHWEKTGSGLFVANRMGAGILLGNSPAWGFSAQTRRLNLSNQSESPHWDVNLLGEIPLKWGDLRGRFYLMWPLKTGASAGRGTRRQNIGKLVLVHKGLAAAVQVDRHFDGTPQAGFQILAALEKGVGLEVRIDPATGSIGPGVSLVRGAFMVRTSHLVHPHLGVTHRLMLVVGKISGGS